VASWAELKQYIGGKYKIEDDQGSMLTMVFRFTDKRSQVVTVSLSNLENGEEWVCVDSPIGKFADLDVTQAVRLAGPLVCGAISSVNDWVTFRDTFPIANLDINEFEGPLHLVTGSADELERELTGRDAI
jgi:hypothetical protein